MSRSRHLALALWTVSTVLAGCNAETLQAPGSVSQSLARTGTQKVSVVAASVEQCKAGGVEVLTYIDSNENNLWDEDQEELLSSNLICSGSDGANGKDGADGKDGLNGKDGADGKDGQDGLNGKDGADGQDGVDGKDGEDGVDGKDGTDGEDGASADPLVYRIDNQAPGCPAGGTTVNLGLDANRNGILDEGDEQIQSFEVCNGLPAVKAQPACAATLKFPSTSKNKYYVEFEIRNLGEAVSSWEVGFQIPEDQRMGTIWHGRQSAWTGEVVVSNMDYNGSVASGESVSFKILVNRDKDDDAVLSAPITFNGVVCE